jgi:hypothetical protein
MVFSSVEVTQLTAPSASESTWGASHGSIGVGSRGTAGTGADTVRAREIQTTQRGSAENAVLREKTSLGVSSVDAVV